MVLKLDATNLPAELHPFIPLAEEWGIDDVEEGSEKIENTSFEDLLIFVRQARDPKVSEPIDTWMEQQEQQEGYYPSEEYMAFTYLFLNMSRAEGRLRQYGKLPPEFM